jgi:hypothetical protein
MFVECVMRSAFRLALGLSLSPAELEQVQSRWFAEPLQARLWANCAGLSAHCLRGVRGLVEARGK